MKIINKSTIQMPDGAALDKGQYENVQQIASAIHEKAEAGVPYTVRHIQDEIAAQPLMDGEDLFFFTFPVLFLLGQYHQWWTIKPWHVYGYGDDKLSLKALADGASLPGVPDTRDSFRAFWETLTGETINDAAVRQALNRLCKKGRFQRYDNKRYMRIHRGI